MCGIFGYVGKEKKDSLKICLQGLKQLEYRGYDSAGVAGLEKGKIRICKERGKLMALEEKISLSDLRLELAIGHTRWATHGEPNETNAHPHLDGKESLALVHNGIIENYALWREKLQAQGIKFFSETDTEVIAQLISFYYKKDLLKAFASALHDLTGSFAIAMIHKDFPNQILAAAKESPLAIAFDDAKTEVILSSDPNAFLGRDLNVVFLRNGEIAKISPNAVEIFDSLLHPIQKKSERFEGKNELPTKGGFEHFMLKEILEQPSTIQKAYLGTFLEEDGTVQFENLKISPKELLSYEKVLILGCGTSWHAALLGSLFLEEMAHISASAEIASEFRFKHTPISDKTLVLAISQSGETADTIAAVKDVKAKGANVLAICNVKNSTITRESRDSLFLKAGPEFSVCSTKAFTSQLTTLFLFALYLGRLRGTLSLTEGKLFLSELKKIPQKIKEIISHSDLLKKMASKYSKFENFFFLGRNYMYPTALEAALKLKEISYLNASAYPAGEMKHGPIALISNTLPVIGLCANQTTYDKILNNLREVKARGAPILAFATKGSKEIETIADDIFWLPESIDLLAPLIATVAGQFFAYFIAKERKTDIDQPRNLAKSVTVE